MERKARILHDVRSALRRSPREDLRRRGIQVFFDGGDLVLDGEVDEVADKKTALRAAAAVPGVSAIIDRLSLRGVERCSDTELLRRARRSIADDPALADCLLESTLSEDHSREEILCPEGWQGFIEIRAEDGVLTLDGEVPSLTHKRLAGVLAWRLPGCRDVVNGLELDPPEEDSDAKIADAVSLVVGRPHPANILSVRVTVQAGVVALEGHIPAEQARAIERDVWAIFGVDQILSSLHPNPTFEGGAGGSSARGASPP